MSDRIRGLHAWQLPVIGWLTVVWLLLWGEITLINLIGGIIVSSLILLVFPFPRVSVEGALRPWRTIVLLSRFLYDLSVASFHVGWLAIRPATPPRSAVILIHLVSGNDLRQTLTGELISLVPGSLLIELDSEGKRMWLHVLDADTPEKVLTARHKARAQEHRLLQAIGTADEVAESERRLQEDA